MLQVQNETPFVPGLFILPDEAGVDTVYLSVKATFHFGAGALQVAEVQPPLVLADTYWGESGASSLKYASEVHLLKPGTDVVLVGDAFAPGGRAVTSCLVSLGVGALQRTLQVFGARQWKGGVMSPRISTPEPFVRMPLRYEHAFGGTHVPEGGRGEVLAEPRNPVGRGFRGRRSASEMLNLPLPNVEDPRALVHSISDAPVPMGLGYVAPSWMPRRALAGTYDEAWKTGRAPYLPRDFKPDYFRAASPGLSAAGFLEGGEPVELRNVTPSGVVSLRLPRCELDVTARIAGRSQQVRMRLETVLLEPGEERLSLLWRGALPCDKQVLKVEGARFRVKSLAGVKGVA
ncbi:DUF2169 family type VI secretion system accessory protein [Corallococcus sicarius]|uniref:DUF2169 domain-containing protein n=1 Tax=Corallococcus sicarius TaxID=2316726 RepID=A0A3A8P202_9BACT|nr:DUF2169 domain-containing protein [Corallococcus sicarius]RKH47405.1 DUF2169 domain-containing protein [Corallococcus sicarius]